MSPNNEGSLTGTGAPRCASASGDEEDGEDDGYGDGDDYNECNETQEIIRQIERSEELEASMQMESMEASDHSRDSSLSSISMSTISKKINNLTGKSASIPESFNKLSNKFKRQNSTSSGSLFARKPSISARCADGPAETDPLGPASDALHGRHTNLYTKTTKNPFISELDKLDKIEPFKFRHRANSSPLESDNHISRKSSISIAGLMKKRQQHNQKHASPPSLQPATDPPGAMMAPANLHSTLGSSTPRNALFDFETPSNTFHSTTDISDEYFLKTSHAHSNSNSHSDSHSISNLSTSNNSSALLDRDIPLDLDFNTSSFNADAHENILLADVGSPLATSSNDFSSPTDSHPCYNHHGGNIRCHDVEGADPFPGWLLKDGVLVLKDPKSS